jgi:hypothetical protein
MKEENRDHFRGPLNVQRVQEWRRAHPGYWHRNPSPGPPLQDVLSENPSEHPEVEPGLEKAVQDPLSEKPMVIQLVEPLSHKTSMGPLQDLLLSQQAVLIGLIAQMIGSPLQDHIASTALRLQQLGTDILNTPTQCKGEIHDPKTTRLSPSHPQGPQPIQLGGSPPGP